jgi:hypothetical protein
MRRETRRARGSPRESALLVELYRRETRRVRIFISNFSCATDVPVLWAPGGNAYPLTEILFISFVFYNKTFILVPPKKLDYQTNSYMNIQYPTHSDILRPRLKPVLLPGIVAIFLPDGCPANKPERRYYGSLRNSCLVGRACGRRPVG